jgi:hypothetical protein
MTAGRRDTDVAIWTDNDVAIWTRPALGLRDLGARPMLCMDRPQ